VIAEWIAALSMRDFAERRLVPHVPDPKPHKPNLPAMASPNRHSRAAHHAEAEGRVA